MGGRGILREVVVLDGEDEARAVGGEIKGASAADGPQVFGSDGAELGCRRGLGGAEEPGRGEQSEEGEAGQTADEGRTREVIGRRERERLRGTRTIRPTRVSRRQRRGREFCRGILTRSARRSQRAT